MPVSATRPATRFQTLGLIVFHRMQLLLLTRLNATFLHQGRNQLLTPSLTKRALDRSHAKISDRLLSNRQEGAIGAVMNLASFHARLHLFASAAADPVHFLIE